MKTNDCPFCDSDILYYSFLESRSFRAICNIAPILPGHSLIVPIRHVERFLDLDIVERIELTFFVARVIDVLQESQSTNSFDFTLQEGSAAGQSVSHLHFHIIPRLFLDLPNPGDWYSRLIHNQVIDSSERPRLSREEMINEAHRIRKFVNFNQRDFDDEVISAAQQYLSTISKSY